ncbi:metallopeptidase TldD-related protein [Actinomadura sp. WMMB 499]|uniref:metallopeptidase TldD-related protein n=1 Tax=Actinomadura sp. WMMB 499 TaxID=1219491 RepID=UPI0012492109|nr:metallopeptidase TldD-related protein [Actinomadura sp. WMMB 499]QFG22926.1 TldD/PmbA family protein [Actinomadura sp. WMMB 499]
MSTAPQDVAERALAVGGPDELVVIVDEADTAYLRWAGNAVTAAGHVRDTRVTVVATAGGRDGTAAGVVARHGEPAAAVRGMVEAAERAARAAPAAPDAAPLPAGAPSPGWTAPPERLPGEVLGSLAGGLREAVGRARAEHRLLYGFARRELRSTYVATSSGLRLRHVQPAGLTDLAGRDADGGTAWTGATACGESCGESCGDAASPGPADLDLRLRDRLRWGRRRVRVPPGRHEVLLSPSCVADLMGHLYAAAGAQDALDGRSPFGRAGGGSRLGERLTDQPLTLRGDPLLPGFECAPFVVARSSGEGVSVFDNGLPLEATEWIRDGTLTALVQTRRSAALTGAPVTPRIDNLRLEGGPGARSLAEMVAGTRRGLLVTSLWYLRPVDPRSLLLTGLTRDGVYLVEDGEIVGAAPDFRFNESPVALLERVTEIGRTVPALPREWDEGPPRAAMPPLRVDGFALSAPRR